MQQQENRLTALAQYFDKQVGIASTSFSISSDLLELLVEEFDGLASVNQTRGVGEEEADGIWEVLPQHIFPGAVLVSAWGISHSLPPQFL